jgi:transglutaminase-like putative cysteine protease
MDYPDWVTERYLQIPESTTQRTLDLALQIASSYDNPYDAAEAITQYLRENIEYTESMPELPTNQDPIDWMLFDVQQGFCNYYATAEIVMLRSLGIPARLGVGYAQGERSQGREDVLALGAEGPGIREIEDSLRDDVTFTVRQYDLHAWPEVYFPGIGWVEFEPTRNQEPLVRRQEIVPASANGSGEDPAGNAERPESPFNAGRQDNRDNFADHAGGAGGSSGINWTAWLVSFGSGLALLGAVLGWRSLRQRGMQPLPVLVELGFRRFQIQAPPFIVQWAHQAQLSPLSKAYMEINKALSRLGQPSERYATPAERAAILAGLLPQLQSPIQKLRDLYHTGTYAQKNAEIETAVAAGKQIRKASCRVWLLKLLKRWQKPEETRTDLISLWNEKENRRGKGE